LNQFLNNLNTLYPNMSNTQAYNHLQALNNQIKNLLQNNPNMSLGQISNLISYP